MEQLKNYSFQSTYHLKAQTPLIHFQHAQRGATLRATEVKPKLDRFLWQRVGEKIEEAWKLKTDQQALNYKLRFVASGELEIVELKGEYDIYYGNTGISPDMQKKGIVGDVDMTVICTIPALKALIDAHIAEFFAVTNFGSMQNKGFGSYTVEGKQYSASFIAQSLMRAYGASKCYTFRPERGVFKAIKVVYGMMKSGVNYTPFRTPADYQRSLLFLFMHEQKEMGNEKAWLKQQGYAPSDVGRNAGKWHKNEHRAYYVRALLGVGDHIDFINDLTNRRDKTTISITNDDKIIERFHSPIFFKVINGNVYFVGKRIEKEIFGKTFTFSSPKGSGKLTVPKEEELGEDFIDVFLDYCQKMLNGGALAKFTEVKGVKIQEVK